MTRRGPHKPIFNPRTERGKTSRSGQAGELPPPPLSCAVIADIDFRDGAPAGWTLVSGNPGFDADGVYRDSDVDDVVYQLAVSEALTEITLALYVVHYDTDDDDQVLMRAAPWTGGPTNGIDLFLQGSTLDVYGLVNNSEDLPLPHPGSDWEGTVIFRWTSDGDESQLDINDAGGAGAAGDSRSHTDYSGGTLTQISIAVQGLTNPVRVQRAAWFSCFFSDTQANALIAAWESGFATPTP